MNLDTLLTSMDMDILKSMEMILMIFRLQSEDDNQMNTAGEPVILVPETSLERKRTLKERRGFWE